MSQKKTSPVTNPDQDMQVLADNLWTYFEPKIKSLLSSGVSYYRAQVTQAASGGTITVQARQPAGVVFTVILPAWREEESGG